MKPKKPTQKQLREAGEAKELEMFRRSLLKKLDSDQNYAASFIDGFLNRKNEALDYRKLLEEYIVNNDLKGKLLISIFEEKFPDFLKK
jgi:hypothetical protein